MARRIIGISLVALAALAVFLVIKNRNSDSNDWPDTAPTSRFDSATGKNVDLDDSEIGVIQGGLDALNEMDHDLAQQTFDMVTQAAFYEDWSQVCPVLGAAADVIEKNGALALSSDAWHATDAILGESVRYDSFDAMRSECNTEFARAVDAQRDALNL